MKPQDIVAIILALCIVLFLIGGIIKAVINEGYAPEIIVDMWESLIQVIAGGLIGYIGGKNSG